MSHMAALIAFLAETKRFHVVLFQESPFPGTNGRHGVLRLKSKGHHTEGAETFEEALEHLMALKENPGFIWNDDWVILDKVLPLIDPVAVLICHPNKLTVEGMVLPQEAALEIENLIGVRQDTDYCSDT